MPEDDVKGLVEIAARNIEAASDIHKESKLVKTALVFLHKAMENMSSDLKMNIKDKVLNGTPDSLLAGMALANIRNCSYEGNLLDGVRNYFGSDMANYVEKMISEKPDDVIENANRFLTASMQLGTESIASIKKAAYGCCGFRKGCNGRKR